MATLKRDFIAQYITLKLILLLNEEQSNLSNAVEEIE